MRKLIILPIILLIIVSIFGCSETESTADIVVTTQPLYHFTSRLCAATKLTVNCLITENVSCLHDYTLQTQQMRAIESAKLVVISGAGLEESFDDILKNAKCTIDASVGVPLLCSEAGHTHEDSDHGHSHEHDPHIWLSPQNAKIMVENIYSELSKAYPQYQKQFKENLQVIIADLDALTSYANAQLSDLSVRELITFHDGFSYLADAFNLTILQAIEEESGREASAAELIQLCQLIETNNLSCIFTEYSGSVSAAQIISSETGVDIYQLDMAMSPNGYFEAMYHNINTLKEALG